MFYLFIFGCVKYPLSKEDMEWLERAVFNMDLATYGHVMECRDFF